MENEENQEQVFHRFPPPLEIAARFPHSHSRGDDREEKWKSKSRIPTFPSRLVVSLQILERRILLNAGSAVLQAHPSIRKCCISEHGNRPGSIGVMLRGNSFQLGRGTGALDLAGLALPFRELAIN